MRQYLLTLVMLLGLTACGPEAMLVSGVATLASYNMNGKSPMDNAMSYAAGRDCNTLKLGENEGAYCVPHALKPDMLAAADAPRVYCFKTMGEVECHCSADPFQNKNEPFVKGRGAYATGATCSGNRALAALTAAEPSRIVGSPLDPPPLPAEAYGEVLEPAAKPVANPAPATHPAAKGPLNLEYSGS
jgi:hypothetical protein